MEPIFTVTALVLVGAIVAYLAAVLLLVQD
jgi:hypothetical protein